VKDERKREGGGDQVQKPQIQNEPGVSVGTSARVGEECHRKKNAHERDSVAEDATIIAALLHHIDTNGTTKQGVAAAERESLWKREARLEQVNREE